jgi:hypothetical protein
LFAIKATVIASHPPKIENFCSLIPALVAKTRKLRGFQYLWLAEVKPPCGISKYAKKDRLHPGRPVERYSITVNPDLSGLYHGT